MKHNWKKQYKLQEIPLKKDICESVSKCVLKQIRDDTQKGNIIMNSKNKKRTALICAAAAALLSMSAIGIHAAAESGLLEKISIWIDGEEVQATISKKGDDYIAYEVVNEDTIDEETIDEFVDVEYEEHTVSFMEDPNTKFYTELDNENHLWLKADTDDTFAVDITDELTQNGSYKLDCCFIDGSMKEIIVSGTIEEPKVEESYIDMESEECNSVSVD